MANFEHIGGFYKAGNQFVKVSFLCLVNCNPGNNILELYNILVQVWAATSKMELDIYYNKVGIRDALRVYKQLKSGY